MLDIELLRTEPERVKREIESKNADPKLVDDLLSIDLKWRAATKELDDLRARHKKLSEERNLEEARKNKETIAEKGKEVFDLESERLAFWMKIPNLPSEDTPRGKDESANKVLRTWREPAKFDFEAKDHVALGEALGLIETKAASKVSGARFAYLTGDAVRLQIGLIAHAFNILGDSSVLKAIADRVGAGYPATRFTPVIPPVMIRPDVFQKMARLEPREERYYLPQDDMFLVGSSEHALGPLHMDEILDETRLPLRYAGYSTCFRREAGSYGKDTHGILRLHQFDKVEIESFTVPEQGVHEQDFFVGIQEYLMQSLEIPYRVVICSTGDQGDPDTRHIDIETWMPGDTSTGSRGAYRETHSADFMADYQARRLQTRIRRSNGAIVYAHMNDATAFAIGRTVVAILENYQTKDGKIRVPKVLQEYAGKERIG